MWDAAMRLKFLFVALAVIFGVSATPLLAAIPAKPELIMFEQENCEWCETWDEQIAPVLPKTPEGKCATFRRVDIRSSAPVLKAIKPIIYTPTFVLMENGSEVGRVLGYAGEDFFWFLLGKELKKLADSCALPN